MMSRIVYITHKCKLLLAITAICVFVIIIGGVLGYLSHRSEESDSGLDIKVGSKAPLFEMNSVMGENCNLKSMLGKTVLLSFVDTQTAVPDKKAADNAGQMNFLRSMYRQYSSKGLVVWLVDASYINTGKNTEKNKLINFSYDWGLKDQFLMLQGGESVELSLKYKVKKLPTTFVINEKGIVTERWDSLALSSQLAMSIENLVGYPEYRNADNNKIPGMNYSTPDTEGTPAQSIFQGLLPARALSDNIWMIDGGKKWKSAATYPIKWLVMDKKGDLNITATATNEDTGKTITLFENKTLEGIAHGEERVILNEFDEPYQHVFLQDIPVQVKEAGKYSIKAYVYRSSNQKTPIYKGEAQVNVE